MDFLKVAYALNDIAQTPGKIAKETLLRTYAKSVDGFTDVLKFIYDPYFTTGLKQAKLDRADIHYEQRSAEEIMDYLRANSTGSDVDAMLANAFIYSVEDPTWEWAATGLVTKDLQIGISVTTLNNVFGKNFIPKIGIMRGMLCPHDWEGYGIATEKIDGNRRLFFNTASGVKTYTRSGKPDTGLTEIEAEIHAHLPVGFVFDCECIAEGDFGDNIELRQASASVLNKRNQQRRGVRALCFDVLKIEEYEQGRSKYSALARKTLLAAMMGDDSSVDVLQAFAIKLDNEFEAKGKPSHLANSVNALRHCYPTSHIFEHIRPLPILGIAASYDEGVELAKPIWDVKGEGVMLVEWQSAYEVNPNPRKTLLKIKMLKEYTAKCIGVYEGDNKYTGMLGGITVDWEGNVFGVGTGFTDYDRQLLWDDPDRIVGKLVELDSFGESVNKQGGHALNCPVFKRIVGEDASGD